MEPLGALSAACYWGATCVTLAKYVTPTDALHQVTSIHFLLVATSLQSVFCLTRKWHEYAMFAIEAEYFGIMFGMHWWHSSPAVLAVTLIEIEMLNMSVSWTARVSERTHRDAWWALYSNTKLKEEIVNLKTELSKAMGEGDKAAADLESPVEKVLTLLKAVRALALQGPAVLSASTEAVKDKMLIAITTLNKHSDLFMADLSTQIKEKKIGLQSIS
eukprot:m51a1_g9125 hypothetical protein (217) ;mRNA; f:1158-1808